MKKKTKSMSYIKITAPRIVSDGSRNLLGKYVITNLLYSEILGLRVYGLGSLIFLTIT
jgi:hypothetical protein